ncbi:hypothetical protein OBBRIDRAFT_884450 [Obba rivulosa]|uniref:Coiled-coil domain-containing protein 16 n=1 Tax=Obba rivulosa TaxID=1052685 RepID=A0A8E2DSJ8_9APHY|nr:hypothetical protein OBBRIDRAFT_884450 [Obba rivulosa]
MADARALLRAKRQEARVNHPLASYNASGQLRCIACGTTVKMASSWEGHVGSKAHRTNVARLRDEEKRREEERLAQKRKTDELEESGDEQESDASHKRQKLDDDAAETPPPPPVQTSGLPTDFFSDPSQQQPPPSDDSEDGAAAPPAAPPDQPPPAIDLEWQQFQAAVLDAPDIRETYERATVVAEPELMNEVPEGFPLAATEGGEEPQPQEVDEAALRRRKELEERELIMDRLLEEERAQEEADAKVAQLKSRLEALKRQREAKRAAKEEG